MKKEYFYRWLKLTGAASLIAIIWLVILPACARTNRFQEYKTFLEDRHINPEAMYYSDLENIPDVLNRLEDTEDDFSAINIK